MNIYKRIVDDSLDDYERDFLRV